jgi:hypothetical protein
MAHTSKQEVTPSGTEGKEVLDTVKDWAKAVVAGAADMARAAKDKARWLRGRLLPTRRVKRSKTWGRS